MTSADIVSTVALEPAVFELVRQVVGPSAYDGVDGRSSVRARVGVDQDWTSVESLAALVRWARENGVDLTVGVTRSPHVFAEFVAFVDLGLRAVTIRELYETVERTFPIHLDSELPRVEGKSLLFLAGRFSVSGQPSIWRVTADVASGAITRERIPARRTSHPSN